MTEDILFDNIFVGHDAAQAKKFAAETYHVKKPLEQEAEGSAEGDDDDEPSALLDKIRLKVYEFIHLCGFDVLQACKQMPDVAAGLAAAFFTLIGMLAALFGLMGSSKPVVKKTKTKAVVAKEPAPVAVDAVPVASADDLKKDETPVVVKRATRASKE